MTVLQIVCCGLKTEFQETLMFDNRILHLAFYSSGQTPSTLNAQLAVEVTRGRIVHS